MAKLPGAERGDSLGSDGAEQYPCYHAEEYPEGQIAFKEGESSLGRGGYSFHEIFFFPN
jgi:hypothetical protein